MYTYMYVCMNLYICTYVCRYVYICICIHTYICVSMYVYMKIRYIHTYVHIHIHIYIYICIYLYIHISDTALTNEINRHAPSNRHWRTRSSLRLRAFGWGSNMSINSTCWKDFPPTQVMRSNYWKIPRLSTRFWSSLEHGCVMCSFASLACPIASDGSYSNHRCKENGARQNHERKCDTEPIYWYGVATISRLLKMIGLFCKRAL